MSAARLAETAARIRGEVIPPFMPSRGTPPRETPKRPDPTPMQTTMLALPMTPSKTIPRQADSDAHLIKLWLHGRPETTQRAYSIHLRRFTDFLCGKPIQEVTLGDLQDFVDSLDGLAPNSVLTILRAIKSLLSFAHKLGYLAFNVGAAMRSPRGEDCLHERYLTQPEVNALLAMLSEPRDHAMVRLLYNGGLRVQELVGLKWRDCQAKGNAGLVVVLGKRNKRRSVLLPPPIWQEITALRNGAPEDAPVFASTMPWKSGHRDNHLGTHHVWSIVKKAALLAGIEKPVTPHWLRHAHISHALDGGAPLHLVQQTVGHANMATTGRYSHSRPDDSSANYLGETGEWEPDPRPPFDGTAIGNARRALGMTQRDLAAELGIHRVYLVRVETGVDRPSEELAGKLLAWLKQARERLRQAG